MGSSIPLMGMEPETEKRFKTIEGQMVVMGYLQRSYEEQHLWVKEMIEDHNRWFAIHEEAMRELARRAEEREARWQEWRREEEQWRHEQEEWRRLSEARWQKIERNMAEITDKLNGLIGYVDGMGR